MHWWWYVTGWSRLAGGVLLFIACALIILRSVRIPAVYRRGALCGRCGYELNRLVEERCPECGAALLRAGVTTPALVLRHRSNGLIAAIAWTCLVGMSVMTASFVLSAFGIGRTTNWDANRNVIATEKFAPGRSYWNPVLNRPVDSHEYSIEMTIDVITNDEAMVKTGTIELTFEAPDRRPRTATIDAVSLAYSVADGESPDPFDAQAAAELIASLGFDIDSDSVQAQASQIAAVVRNVRSSPDDFGSIPFETDADPYARLHRSGHTSSSTPIGLPSEAKRDLTVAGFGALFWAVGLISLHRRRRKVLGDVEMPDTAP